MGRRMGKLRLLAFGLMLSGCGLAYGGQYVEARSFRESPSMFEGGLSSEDRAGERRVAYAMKNAGLGLVLAGPVVWAAGWLLTRRRAADEPSESSARM